MMRLGIAVLAYLVPTFVFGFVWHLVLFEQYYKDLQIYRADIIIPFGFLAILIQGGLFAWIYERAFVSSPASLANRAISYGLLGAILSWSFTTLTVAAKNIMVSVPDYLLIETAFTLAQWAIVAPLTALALSRSANTSVTAPV
jgi:hypothetical protein